jgi:hypothetical protein
MLFLTPFLSRVPHGSAFGASWPTIFFVLFQRQSYHSKEMSGGLVRPFLNDHCESTGTTRPIAIDLLLSGPPIEPVRPIDRSSSHQHTQVVMVVHHPVEERQVMRGDILQMLASKEDKASMMMFSSSNTASQSPPSTTAAAAASSTSLRQKGQNASGRTWKVRPQKRASTLVTSKVNGRVKDWADRQAERECRRETVRVQKEMEDAKRQEAIDKKQRKLENEKRRQENELKNLERSGAIQALNHDRVGRTLKAMNKKQLRHIKKSRVNTKTGIVEFVPAYAK